MSASYKQKCIICKKNYAMVSWNNRTPICTECGMLEISKPIKDEKFKKMFNIKKELYERSSFLRNIKASYLRFGHLTEKQIEMFKKVAEEVKLRKDKKEVELPQPEKHS